MFLLLSRGKGQRKCAVELESGVTLETKGAALHIMGGLVPVLALPTIEVVHGQGHTLLLQDGEMTTQLPHRERIRTPQNLLGVSQKNMMKRRSGDPTLLPVEMATLAMLITVMRRGRPHLTAMDPLHTGGLLGTPQGRLQDPALGPPMFPLPAATDRTLNQRNGIAA